MELEIVHNSYVLTHFVEDAPQPYDVIDFQLLVNILLCCKQLRKLTVRGFSREPSLRGECRQCMNDLISLVVDLSLPITLIVDGRLCLTEGKVAVSTWKYVVCNVVGLFSKELSGRLASWLE